MNRTEHILTCISEESSEIGQAVGKALRFGLTEVGPYNKGSNNDSLITEINDLLALVEEAGRLGILDITNLNDPVAKANKVNKYYQYANYSSDLGLLDTD